MIENLLRGWNGLYNFNDASGHYDFSLGTEILYQGIFQDQSTKIETQALQLTSGLNFYSTQFTHVSISEQLKLLENCKVGVEMRGEEKIVFLFSNF